MKTTILILMTMIAAPAFAGSVVDTSQLTWAGSGCTASDEPLDVYYGENSGRLLVFLPNLAAGEAGTRLERKTCSLALPVQLPPGKRLKLGAPAIFGLTDLRPGSKITAQSEVFLAGSTGPKVVKELESTDARVNRYFYERAEETLTSGCGTAEIIRANLSLVLTHASDSRDSRALVDGAALTALVEDCE